ncbi:hypothetical protein CDL15_Pgr018086 [Punica granatum]|uniref:Uncharacterized protein n=1 Tax=Punica granatum TaxID=22663 RepID=A0A218WJI4_PUNGR|nr:hypothetical protein CDL15_Pgr018086 [Punica granatum]
MISLTCAQLSSSSLRPPLPRFTLSLPDLKPLRARPRIPNKVPHHATPPSPSIGSLSICIRAPRPQTLFVLWLQRRVRNGGPCRAELSHDAPFAAAIGACMLSSVILPVATSSEEDGDAAMDSTDARFAVMGIISFIPYFNWLSWVFAWLDTGRRRYAVYALVYLAPYIRSNLSLSPEESWLPIASIVFCIIHVQLEASIRNGDVQGFQLFSEAARKRDTHSKGHRELSEEERQRMNLPSADKRSTNEIRQRDIPRKPVRDQESLREDWDDDDDHRREP